MLSKVTYGVNTLGSPKLGTIYQICNMYHLVVHDANAFISPGNLEQNYDFPEYVFHMIQQFPTKNSAHPIFFPFALKTIESGVLDRKDIVYITLFKSNLIVIDLTLCRIEAELVDDRKIFFLIVVRKISWLTA